MQEQLQVVSASAENLATNVGILIGRVDALYVLNLRNGACLMVKSLGTMIPKIEFQLPAEKPLNWHVIIHESLAE